jgi:DNA replication and repair protein RecF
MFVKSLTLTNFRNYSHLDCKFTDTRIFINGANGIGKTTILEAIYYLTLGRSFRKAEDSELIRKGEKEASIYLVFHTEKDDKDHTLSCVIGQGYKAFAYDNEKVRSLSKILGLLTAVYYDPSLVFFFKDEPQERRKLLDATLSQLSPEYLYAISRYKKLLKERNAALVQGYDTDIIAVLKNELINLSYRIVKDRKELISSLSNPVSDYYKKLFGEDKNLALTYITTCPLDDDQTSFVKNSQELFKKNQSLENIRKMTLIGPHRDNLTANLNDKDLASYGSQGENRLASLSLKLAIKDLLAKKLGQEPILLLDDVTSDLDETRCSNLLHTINEKGQVFVTGTKVSEQFKDYDIYVTDGNQLVWRNQK